MRRSVAWVIAVCVAGCLAAPVAAGTHPDSTCFREVRATRCTAAISVDGTLDEAVWQQCEAVDWFTQRDPDEGRSPTQRTEVRVLYDDAALYVGARMFDSSPDSIVARLSRRDVDIQSDELALYVDPYYDRRSGYFFSVNAGGTMYDGTLSNDGSFDNSWDGVWEGRSKIDSQGWTVEMRVPFTQLRFAKGDVQKWGINFERMLTRRNETDYLAYQPKKASGFVSRFPTLIGMENVSPGSAIEVMPYYTTKAEYLQHDPLDPFHDGSEYKPNVGGDLRMALGGKLTLNATVNPDFGQVEVDPAVVNLSDLETFFPEKRPFFVQGSSIFSAGQQGASDYWGFNFPNPTFFYSRRIGRTLPDDAPSGADFADVPDATTIWGAAKIAGKLAPGMNVGMVHALTAKEEADVQWSDASHGQVEVEPLAYFGVGRALKEFKDRRNGLGVLGTYAARNFSSDDTRNAYDNTGALALIDGWHFLDANKVWVLSGWAGMSRITGTQERITAVQQNSRHYFQRPDAKNFSVDPNATSLTGAGARVWLNKEKGAWFSNSAIGFLSPGFEINDLGFMSRADITNAHVGVGHQWTERTKVRKYQNVVAALFGGTDFDGNLTTAGAWIKGETEFANNYSWQYSTAYNPETVLPRRSRGGPLMLNAPGYEFYMYFDTDGKAKRFYFIEGYSYFQPEENSVFWNVFPGIELKPMSNLTLRIGPGYERSRDGAFYVATLDDPAATATYGKRYIFAQLDQKTLSANIRLNMAFTPRMSLQFYGQPLIATGEYTDYRELAQPKSLDFYGPGQGAWTYDDATHEFDEDGPGGPSAPYSNDFNAKSLLGNAVFRWEYMPGSALYLVWTQQRSDVENTAELDVGQSFKRLIDVNADNKFLAKVTYYFSR